MSALRQVSLDDKYAQEEGTIFITGVQALVRLPLMQRRLDDLAGLKTGGFISGYRGSPLGTYDSQLAKSQALLDAHNIVFEPGINEDLGATAVWGSQQVGLFPGATVDGVFGIWYGKGPGVDRTGDVFKHANMAGTSKHGGVLAFAGDDHACKSSTLPNQSEFSFIDAEMPVLNPCGVEELLEFGIKGWALSRYSGSWIGMKTIADTMDSTATVTLDPARYATRIPQGVELPPEGLNILLSITPQRQEERHRRFRLPAVQAFARANGFDRIVIDSPRPRFGIMATGKAYLHVRQALQDLGISDARAAELGIRVLKVGLTWPLDPVTMRAFADGLETVLVVEERRDVMEHQLKALTHDLPDGRRPRILGKRDRDGQALLPDLLELDAALVAKALVASMPDDWRSEEMTRFVAWLNRDAALPEKIVPLHTRTPYFCSGCPHNSSTNLPDGSRATSGIGCHFLVQWMNRRAEACTHMGGEGVPWVGQSRFTNEQHIFANLGDGTYFHSGYLAIRQALASKVNITYKILYNDAVAMTGGQSVEGVLTVPLLARQLAAEGVKRIALVSDDPERYRGHADMPGFVTYDHRSRLDAVQRELREVGGVSVLIYDQTCATEKRRRRKRGLMAEPKTRAFINDLVCEGCGDCSKKSNCLSVEPLETEFGRKRRIEQSSCNKDFSCVEGFCPSFVSVSDGVIARAKPKDSGDVRLPDPVLPPISADSYNILLTGIGGQGVTALAAILGMAAHLEGKTVAIVDQLGMAQKGGGVYSHIRIGAPGSVIHGPRVGVGSADLIIAADMVVGAGRAALPRASVGRTHAVVNGDLIPTSEFVQNTNVEFKRDGMIEMLGRECQTLDEVEAARLALELLGDAIFTNVILLGVAYQKGLVPLGFDAIDRAIELNGVAVKANKQAFAWGRRFALDPQAVRALLTRAEPVAVTLDEIVAKRVAELTAYQDAAYAARYKALVDRVAAAERTAFGKEGALSEAVARSYYKLLAYKDEYEVARLYSDGRFIEKLKAQFSDHRKLEVHLAPPLLSRKDPDTGLPKKRKFGPWIFTAFRLLAKFKGLRGTRLDIFGWTAERKMERALITAYEADVAMVLARLDADTQKLALELLKLPEDIRGFGHVKEQSVKAAEEKRAALCAAFKVKPTPVLSNAA